MTITKVSKQKCRPDATKLVGRINPTCIPSLPLRAFVIALTSAVSVFSGCGIEQRPSSDVRYFLLDVQRPGTEAAVKTGACLHIRPCRVAAPFSSRSLVYRTSTVLYEQDYYNLFLTHPDGQVTDALRGWFRQSSFANCVSADETAPPPYTLEPRVDVLCADFTDKENPAAVVQMHVLLTKFDKGCSCPKVVLEKTYSTETPLPVKPAAAQIVEGLSQSLSQILQQLENELAGVM